MAFRPSRTVGAGSARKAVWAAIAVAWLTAVVAGLVGVRAVASSGRGVDAAALILAHQTVSGTGYATVRFATARGPMTVTIPVCHHQAYPVGGTVVVRYKASNPSHVWERDMPPRPSLVVPLVILAAGSLAAIGLLVSAFGRARRVVASSTDADAPQNGLGELEAQLEDASLGTDFE
jgi:hypothetical protein